MSKRLNIVKVKNPVDTVVTSKTSWPSLDAGAFGLEDSTERESKMDAADDASGDAEGVFSHIPDEEQDNTGAEIGQGQNDEDTLDDLLKRLEAYGQRFMTSFDIPVSMDKKRKRTDEHENRKSGKIQRPGLDTDAHEDSDEEWNGFGDQLQEDMEDEELESDDDIPDDEYADNDDDIRVNSTSRSPSIVVFSEGVMKASSSSTRQPTKPQLKAFMSSKVSKVTQDVQEHHGPGKSSDNPDDEKTNAQNDALLHRLIHTQLLSGSSNPDLALKPAQRRKAFQGRVLELAGGAKLGKGEKLVRVEERKKAAKNVRLGILKKQKERAVDQLEEAKNLGNYHPTIKKLFDASESSQKPDRKREKGLKMGVGKFSDGVLRLSRDEIHAMQGVSRGSRGRGRGKGRRR